MPATVLIREKNGAGETATDKTSGTIRFKNADNATVDLVDPLVVPTANTEYSFEKFARMHISAGSFSQLENLEFYMDGAKGWQAGVKLWGRDLAAYTTPAVPTETNDPPQIPVGGTPVAATDAFTWTSAAPVDLGAGPFDSTGLPKDIGDYLDMVVEVEIGSTQGVLAAETATWRWDEI
jgi:hypothetical protein